MAHIVKNKQSSCYQVRWGFTKSKKGKNKSFSIKKLGEETAYLMAVRLKQEKEKEEIILKPIFSEVKRVSINSNNSSGVTGFYISWDITGEYPLAAMCVNWKENGRYRHSSFSINKHGLHNALTFAVERRNRGNIKAPSFDYLWHIFLKQVRGLA